jgi:hypothetical protein
METRPVTWGGSEGSGILAAVYISLGGRRMKAEIVFVDDIKLGYALLGRHTIFTAFNEVCFIENARNEGKRVELRY